MTTHCNQGDKPIIKYHFQGDTKNRIFKTKFSPIDVTVKTAPVESTNNFSGEGFQVTFYSSNNFRDVSFVVRDYKIVNKGYLEFNYIDCGKTIFTTGGPTIDPSTIVINSNIKCPSNSNSQRCSIEISHKGIILFQDQGNCPVSYSVQCGKCPDGQHECESKVYPYYCCSDCADTAQKIKDIASKVGR